jgi:hypothetical protein
MKRMILPYGGGEIVNGIHDSNSNHKKHSMKSKREKLQQQ